MQFAVPCPPYFTGLARMAMRAARLPRAHPVPACSSASAPQAYLAEDVESMMRESLASPGNTSSHNATQARRGFFTRLLALATGGLIMLVPGAAGLVAFLDPLFRRGGRAREVPVASLAAVPDDGVPRQFPVIADRQDAWNHFPAQPIGAVFLRRLPGTEQVQALNATCPHAGCMVAYQPAAESFRCPCHTSRFKPDGSRILPCVSPRDLDSLETEVRDGVVWVKYQDFYTGKAQKIARQ